MQIKSGGHASNPGYSSTTGVQISMARFNTTVFNRASMTATVGSGLLWEQVLGALQPYNVSVVGGRSTGVGVGGFLLGGGEQFFFVGQWAYAERQSGYSWLSNQHGLGVDNIVGYELVLPNGDITQVTESHHPDLFFALKGGFNNYVSRPCGLEKHKG
jgi:FAD/FMN-containing dehydrogenase